ncbi:MAG: phenylalanine--tRNA ligase subunit beta [Chloroflexi bacterium]|nr:phenylalanine--tRNA ligase subunit beta [Chloroflexota bacterium]
MRVPVKWLSEYVDIALPLPELARRLTMAGLEVGEIITSGGDWEGVSIAQVVEVAKHPKADRLVLATVELGGGERQTVVCGAPNVAAGQKVAFAREGVTVIDGRTGKPTALRRAVIRGVESVGMICSEKELGLSDYHEGIVVLPEDAAVGAPLASYLGDSVLDFDLRPNRPDALSVVGVAREVGALTGQPVREPSIEYAEAGPPIKGRVTVEVPARDLCPRYCAALIEGIRTGPSPVWMQERLTAAGLRLINNVVDITNYVMLEMGQPLHAFDFKKLRGGKIVVRRGRPGERLALLDGSQKELPPDVLVIADAEVAVAVAGVMGGADSEVDDKTTTVLLESANFNAASIRRTSQALKVRTDASNRFEKGLSRELPKLAACRAVKLMVELCGAKAAQGIVDVYPGREKEVRITVTQERLRRVLGVDLPVSRVRQVLGSLGFSCRHVPPDRYVVRVPHWRTDVRIPDDVAEEVARIVGYDELPMTQLRGEVPAAERQPRRELRERARDVLAAAGMQEVVTYSLTDRETLAKVLDPEDMAIYPPLRIANPMSREQEYLRTTLRADLLETLASGLRVEPGVVALFETSRVYLPREDDLPQEVESVCGVLSGVKPDRWGQPQGEAVGFFDAKGIIERLLAGLEVNATFEEGHDFAYLPGHTAAVTVGDGRAGLVGQVHPRVAAGFDIDQDVFMFELNLEALLPHVPDLPRYQPVARFPSVEQDLAVTVDESLPAARVQEAIEGSPLVRRARLFDVYTGPPVPPGKKSLAFSVSFQSPGHTLTDAEVEEERRRIVQRLERELGATLRG